MLSSLILIGCGIRDPWLLFVKGRFLFIFFFFSSRRRHTRCGRDWSSDVCSSDLTHKGNLQGGSQDFSLIVSGAGDEMPQEVLLSIEEHALNSLNLYPNPVMDVLYVSGDLDVLENSSVVIYDVNGKKIIETVLKQEMGIDVSVLTEGMYILSISKNGVKQNYKFIKK